MEVKVDKPSSKARKQAYETIYSLWHLLHKLGMNSLPDEDDDDGHRGWRDWVIKHVPASKRGGPKNHAKT